MDTKDTKEPFRAATPNGKPVYENPPTNGRRLSSKPGMKHMKFWLVVAALAVAPTVVFGWQEHRGDAFRARSEFRREWRDAIRDSRRAVRDARREVYRAQLEERRVMRQAFRDATRDARNTFRRAVREARRQVREATRRYRW